MRAASRPAQEALPAPAAAADSERPPPTPSLAPASSADQERERIMTALTKSGGNQTRAAELLGISRRTLSKRLDKYGFPRPRKGRAE